MQNARPTGTTPSSGSKRHPAPMPNSLYPLKLEPSLHVKVWGGRKLAVEMGKNLPANAPYGEAWELHDTSIVANGALRGLTLGDLLLAYGTKLTGRASDPSDGFPLLAKMIDAADWLSVQVHPNDRQAHELEGEPRGKTEAWVVLSADADAQLVIGLKPGTSRDEMAAAIHANQLENYLVYADVRAGDVLYIPANTVHALGPGLLIYEIQQSSDITYRLYDWGRMGLDGRPRELHIDKGLQVSNLDSLPRITRPDEDLIVDGDYFRTWRHQLQAESMDIATGGSFQSLTCIEGLLWLQSEGYEQVVLGKGQTGLIPACIDAFTIKGSGTVLRSSPEQKPH